MTKKQYVKLSELMLTFYKAVELLTKVQDAKMLEEIKNSINKLLQVILEYIQVIGGPSTILVQYLYPFREMINNHVILKEVLESLMEIDTIYQSISYENISAEILRKELKFSEYIDLLMQCKEEGLGIGIAVSGTSCGSKDFTYELGEKLRSIGLDYNISNISNYAYCAVLNDGMKVYEKVSENPIEFRNDTGDFVLRSCPFGILGQRSTCDIRINEIEYGNDYDGLYIVVCSSNFHKVLDAVWFGTSRENLPVFHIIKFNEFIQEHPEVAFLKQRIPAFPNKNLTEKELFILEHITETFLPTTLDGFNNMKTILEYVGDVEGVKEVLTQPEVYVDVYGNRYLKEYHGKYLNCVNGKRFTCNQPDYFKRTIYVVGGCVDMGIGVRDEGTYASRLQKILNDRVPNEGFIVENCATGLTGVNGLEETYKKLDSLFLKPGDIVLGIGDKFIDENPKISKKPYKFGEIYFDIAHLAEGGHYLLAEGYYEVMKKNHFFREKLSKERSYEKYSSDDSFELSYDQIELLKQYKQKLSNYWTEKFHKSHNVGAVVMNCNPFTLGHRYLIEKAADNCEYLIVFVVEEDKSEFTFKERFNLVKQGVSDLKNVLVIESGKFIISTVTFKGYFNKASLQNQEVDSSQDVLLFAKEIAPCIGINKRFVGTEPLDRVTRQYNNTLKRILPAYGIDLVEIDRLIKNGRIVSASSVRKLIEEKNWQAIKDIVPYVTYKYLYKKYAE